MQSEKGKSFSFRPGESLLGKIDQVKRLLGLSASDTAREALDAGLNSMLKRGYREQTMDEFTVLDANHTASLRLLVDKESRGSSLSRAEWYFVADKVNQTYRDLPEGIETLDPDLIAANLRAFSALIALRDETYPSLRGQEADRYYYGNMGYSYIDTSSIGYSISGHVDAAVSGFVRPHFGSGDFPSRNLLVALRDEPDVDVSKLNYALKPFLKPLLMVALRGYWLKEKRPLVQAKESQYPFITLPKKSNAHFHLSPLAEKNGISCAIEPVNHHYVFALNNYVEISDFSTLFSTVENGREHARVPGFTLSKIGFRTSSNYAYILGSGRWRHFFSEEEFESIKALMNDFTSDLAVESHLKSLEMVYGKV
jgi:hypothetical protein